MRIRRAFVTIVAVSVALTAMTSGAYASSPDKGTETEQVTTTEKATVSPPSFEQAMNERAKPNPNHNCGETGPKQKQVETLLASLGGYGTVYVDGKQSVEDCAAIKKFQKRMGIKPVAGYAGPVTYGVAKRIADSSLSKCKHSTKRETVCIDLTHQTLWILNKSGKRILGPTVVRTGMKGYATTPGTHKINVREYKHWSKPYKVWLYYWQHFHDGEGLHETTTYIHDASIGSHGCANLLPSDAKKAYDLLSYNDYIKVFGKRPGT
ncbi:L,D-transpeptidase family protein [Stackebrandtia nassauensis]|uniref:ErfK/YbiS/YcfS/YnhG family protein n=1 Tax=Stackebrandtia nassauensis (strain DSM 44728 / CIP 108903 / NRRL B-16338 / NBRC 102104 / LLR-40K-21) TaxID=446470 RepID=D3Q1E2_STANL|nr:L,D-transpeptidase family protein [Stackebrandtia nassauensis]ADD45722.1 ErfK/YbiS/YcfS/YnhG family protein [Stackebrandtia nassauensis DSM 44728]